MRSSKSKPGQRLSSGTEGKLHFPWPGVLAAIEEAKTALAPSPLYDRDTGRGLWLVGDHGVYLMSNASIDRSAIVYANECDPAKMDFDTWWAVKRATFGGDDGVEFIGIEEIEFLVSAPPQPAMNPRYLAIGMTPDRLIFSIVWNTKASKGRGGMIQTPTQKRRSRREPALAKERCGVCAAAYISSRRC